MNFLGMSWMEIAVIAVVALIVLGPEKLPSYARKASRLIRQFRKVTSGLTREISQALELETEDGEGITDDLKKITKSLEEDAAALKKSLSDDFLSVENTVNKSVNGIKEDLSRESAEISASLTKNIESAKQGISAGMAEAQDNLGITDHNAGAIVEYKPPPLATDSE